MEESSTSPLFPHIHSFLYYQQPFVGIFILICRHCLHLRKILTMIQIANLLLGGGILLTAYSGLAMLHLFFSSVQFSSVAQSCPTLCNPMNRSTPGLPVHHQLPEFTQTQVHRVSDAIQPSHPLLSPSPPAPNLSQHQGLFQ